VQVGAHPDDGTGLDGHRPTAANERLLADMAVQQHPPVEQPAVLAHDLPPVGVLAAAGVGAAHLEVGRTQRGKNNAYCHDSELTWVDWELDEPRRDLLAFTRRLFELRRRWRALYRGGFPTEDHLLWLDPDGREMDLHQWHDPELPRRSEPRLPDPLPVGKTEPASVSSPESKKSRISREDEMKRVCLVAMTLLLVCLLTSLTACDFGKESRAWRERVEALERQVELMRRMVDENWKATIKAVPGERYLQLIDALHGPDGPEKEAAKRFLVSLGNLRQEDLASPWAVSVWAEYEGEGPVRMDAFSAPSPSRLHVEQFIKEKGFKPAESMGGEILHRPRTRTEIDQTLDQELGALFNALAGYPGTWSGGNGRPRWVGGGIGNSGPGRSSHQYQFQPGLLDTAGTNIPVLAAGYSPFGGGLQAHPWFQKGGSGRDRVQPVDDYRARLETRVGGRRDRFVGHLKSAILSTIDTVPLATTAMRFEEPWDVVGKAQTLFILVREKDWKRVGGVRISVAVHKAGDPNAVHPASRLVHLDPSELTQPAHEPVADRNPEAGRYLWAAVRMIDYPSFDRSAPATTYEELRANLEELDRLLGLTEGSQE
jgi:hypothetical protein